MISPTSGIPPIDPRPALMHAMSIADQACYLSGCQSTGVRHSFLENAFLISYIQFTRRNGTPNALRSLQSIPLRVRVIPNSILMTNRLTTK